MFIWLQRSAIYIRIQPNWLSVRIVTPQFKVREYADIPQVILQRDKKSGSKIKLLEVGSSTKTFPVDETRGIIRCNGFEHPRVIIGDLDVASETLKVFIGKAFKGKRLLLPPRIIMHPLGQLEGGLSDLEVQALIDLNSRLGAGPDFAEVYIFTGRELTNEEVLKIHRSNTVFSKKPKLTDLLKDWLKTLFVGFIGIYSIISLF